MTLGAGTRLGHFEIINAIGSGGMGDVYKARDTRLDRLVAIKVSKAQFNERFAHEALAVAALNHPNICQLYDVGPNYLVMEFIDGVPISGPVPLELAVRYARQILDALDAAHAKGFVHRDLKPANILVSRQGLKLLDFGLAKRAIAASAKRRTTIKTMTGPGHIVGTLHYMSPEQLQGKPVDHRSDLFSFGCVLYELLTGRRPFDGASPADVIAAILDREPAPLEIARPLDRVLKRSLAKDPDQRFQTARDLQAAVTWALEQPAVGTPAPRRPRLVAALAAALVLGPAVGWLASTAFRSPVPEPVLRVQVDPPEGSRFVVGINTGGFALSPDGRTVAYVATDGGRTALWIRDLDTPTARLVEGSDNAGWPFWSPDSRSIGFFTGADLRRVDLTGGPPRILCEGVVAGRGATWTDDGRILFASAGSTISQVPTSGGSPAPLTSLDAMRRELTHYRPQALPGNRFLFSIRSQSPENSGVYAASLDDPVERVRLLTTDTNAIYAPGGDGKRYLLWLRGSTLLAQEFDPEGLELVGEPRPVADPVGSIRSQNVMAVSASATGLILYDVTNTLRQLTWFDRTGRSLGTLGDPGPDSWFRLSPDGRNVVVARDSSEGADLWIFETQRSLPRRLTSGPAVALWPIWSPDGGSVAFSGGSSRNLVLRSASGAGPEHPLAQSASVQNPLDWSRDGRFLLFYEINRETQRDLWILPMAADGKGEADRPSSAKPRPYLQSRFNEWHARFSPEASPRWVAYSSDESGRFEVYVQAFPDPRGAWPVSTGGGLYPVWGSGGRELFYLAPDGYLMAVSLKLGANTVEAAPAARLFALPAVDTSMVPYDKLSDGDRFLVNALPERARQSLTLIVNWPALLN
jgi:Tol biopolymer transport system component